MGVTPLDFPFFPCRWLDFLNRAKIFLKCAPNTQKILTEMAAQPHLAALRFLDDLDFERFGIRAILAHGNPSDKGDRVRLKIRGQPLP